MPSRLSWYARRLAPMRVEVKTSTWRKSRDCTRYASSSRLRSRRTGCATCCTNSAAVLSRRLGLHVDPPDHHSAAQADVFSIGADTLLHLRSQLPRRGKNERAYRMACWRRARIGVSREPLQERERESRGLAGAGLGAP